MLAVDGGCGFTVSYARVTAVPGMTDQLHGMPAQFNSNPGFGTTFAACADGTTPNATMHPRAKRKPSFVGRRLRSTTMLPPRIVTLSRLYERMGRLSSPQPPQRATECAVYSELVIDPDTPILSASSWEIGWRTRPTWIVSG